MNEIMQRWADAIGGIERLKSITATRTKSTLQMSGLTGTMEVLQTADGKHRQKVDLAGIYKTEVAFAGEQGWVAGQQGAVTALSGPQLQQTISRSYIGSFSHLIEGRMAGTIEDLGDDGSGTCGRLRIAPAGGNSATYFIDRATGLPVKEEHSDGDRRIVAIFSDWREVGGIKFPFRIERTGGDARTNATLVVEQVEINAPFDASEFERPAESRAPGFAPGPGGITLPFELIENHIHLGVCVNHSDPLPFVFDTGAAASVIDIETARSLELEMVGNLRAEGAGEASPTAALLKDAAISLPGAEQIEVPLRVAVHLDAIAPRLGRRIAGVLGFDFISQFVAEIDYPARTLRLFDARKFQYEGGGETIPLSFRMNIPIIQAQIAAGGAERAEGAFALDLGASTALWINAPFAEKHELRSHVANLLDHPAAGTGVGGDVSAFIGRVDALKFGNQVFEKVVTMFPAENSGVFAKKTFDGNIGAEIMRRFKVVLDYTNARVCLEPNSSASDPFEFDMSGIVLTASGPELSLFIIHAVVPNTPASDAGLQAGDRLLSINQKPAEEFSLNEIHELFKQEGQELRLTAERGEEVIERTLRLRRLV